MSFTVIKNTHKLKNIYCIFVSRNRVINNVISSRFIFKNSNIFARPRELINETLLRSYNSIIIKFGVA
jgi:hypothetical protein